MRRMKEKDDLMKVQESNHEQLIESLQTLVVSNAVFCLLGININLIMKSG